MRLSFSIVMLVFKEMQPVNSFANSLPRRMYDTASMTTFSKNGPGVSLKASQTSEENDPSFDETLLDAFSKYYNIDDGQKNILSFELKQFKPLGCTAEESLVEQEDGSKAVFISKIVEGGNAEKAGLKVGDAIVGVSGNFKDIVNVVGINLEKVKSLIGAREEAEGLVLKIIRGSDVMAQHESTMVQLCVVPENDKDVDKCIEAMYRADYDIRNESLENADDESSGACDDGDVDCMLDSMLDLWGEEMGIKKEEVVEEVKTEKKKPAPWSSRSSPSGTFVRDPKTGRMVNIDE